MKRRGHHYTSAEMGAGGRSSMINGCALARQADSERCAHIDFTADFNLASVFLTMLYDSDSPNPVTEFKMLTDSSTKRK